MYWKRIGNQLEWIVRQMSWNPPWTHRGTEQQRAASTTRFQKSKKKRVLVTEPPETQLTIEDAPEEAAAHCDKIERDSANASDTESNPFSDASSQDARETEDSDAPEDDVFSNSAPSAYDDEEEAPEEKPVVDEAPPSWSQPQNLCVTDHHGYGRIPAFWFTLNFPYNMTWELHRFCYAVEEAKEDPEITWEELLKDESLKPQVDTTSPKRPYPDVSDRCRWVQDNPDSVAVMHAIRVELNVKYVIQRVVKTSKQHPFKYFVRFEWGSGGNPHAHGQAYAADNPDFEYVVEDEETKQQLIADGYPDARKLRTRREAELQLGKYSA